VLKVGQVERPLIFHDVAQGASRLMAQPRDLPRGDVAERPLRHSPPEYRDLFDRYVKDLEAAATVAIDWWNAMVRLSMAKPLEEQEAIRANYEARPAAVASRPELVFVVRDYWLKTVALNEAGGTKPGVPPQCLLLGWLPEAGHDLLYSILTSMPYWPVGIDADGRWC
jgi:hypothetical protein